LLSGGRLARMPLDRRAGRWLERCALGVVACGWALLLVAAGASGSWGLMAAPWATVGIAAVVIGSGGVLAAAVIRAAAERPRGANTVAVLGLVAVAVAGWFLVGFATGVSGACCDPPMLDPLIVLYSWPEALVTLSVMSLASIVPLRLPARF
jgi:hypothetical protein